MIVDGLFVSGLVQILLCYSSSCLPSGFSVIVEMADRRLYTILTMSLYSLYASKYTLRTYMIYHNPLLPLYLHTYTVWICTHLVHVYCICLYDNLDMRFITCRQISVICLYACLYTCTFCQPTLNTVFRCADKFSMGKFVAVMHVLELYRIIHEPGVEKLKDY